MKKQLASLLLIVLSCASGSAGNWFGGGPFTPEGTYYPGQLNGKYQAIVSAPAGSLNTISGVLGFAIVDGAPPSRQTETQTADFFVVARNVELGVDPFQNYFAIFVDGQVYRGQTVAGINPDSGAVSGALQGTDPAANQGLSFTNIDIDGIAYDVPNTFSIINRGLSGGFSANVTQNKATYTFSGQGNLSTPSQAQTVSIDLPLIGPPPPGASLTTVTVSATGNVQTATVPFLLSGIKTSNFATNAVSSAQAAQ
jgi:hypothetical protein